MKLSEMRDLLASRGIQLTKSLGQNFLHDANQLARIAALADIQPGDNILEIGPGLGPLTEVLLRQGAHVFAIEKDKRLCAVLQERFAGNAHFELLHADALDYLQGEARSWAGWKLVSNLPYSVGSPILVELASSPRPPALLVATLQLEVVQRILARAGEPNYGQLSLFLQVAYEPGSWFKIPSGSFFPPPDIDSACVVLRLRDQALVPREQVKEFQRVVKRAFSERRKVMLKLLKTDWPADRLAEIFRVLQIDPQARAETVSVEQFASMTRMLAETK